MCVFVLAARFKGIPHSYQCYVQIPSFTEREGARSMNVCTVRHPFNVGVEWLSCSGKRRPQYEYWMAQLKSIPNLLIRKQLRSQILFFWKPWKSHCFCGPTLVLKGDKMAVASPERCYKSCWQRAMHWRRCQQKKDAEIHVEHGWVHLKRSPQKQGWNNPSCPLIQVILIGAITQILTS